MFDQLAWSIGMFTSTACVLLGAGYLLRHHGVVDVQGAWLATGDRLSSVRGTPLPALALVAVYVLEIAILYEAYAEDDVTALDWAAAVPMLGALVLAPLAGASAVLVILLVRVNLSYLESADPATVASYAGHGLWNLDPRFWREEAWLWAEPGVVLIAVSGFASVAACLLWRERRRREYPLWLGIPLAGVAQAAFTLSATSRWGHDSGMAYLRDEALPAGVGQALATTALIVSLRAAAGARERARARVAEDEAARHRIRHLDAQIDPHFLANGLNAVAAVMDRRPDRARALLDSLATHCRAKCDASGLPITLREELAMVRCYLDIEKARMGSRLVVEERLAEGCDALLLPRLVVQPLVENAVRHGRRRLDGTAHVRISVTREADRLIVSIEDGGDGLMANLTPDRFGTGLSNVHARLRHRFGDAASLVITGAWGSGTTATLTLPATAAAPVARPAATPIAA